MIIKEVDAAEILDSRNEKTILVSIKTDIGNFSASAPSGKSVGKFEASAYKKNLKEDIEEIKKFSDYFSEETLKDFDDLKKIEEIIKGHIGANTLFSLESCALKAIAKEQNPKNFPWKNFGATKSKKEWEDFVGKQIWLLINPKLGKTAKLPRLVGNCIGGGKHSQTDGRKPDFQEFLLIPKVEHVFESWDINKNAKVDAEIILKNVDEKFEKKKNDEDAWITSIDDKRVLEVMKDLKDNAFDERSVILDEGIDLASSGFCSRKKYHYKNPKLDRTKEEHFEYLCNLIKNFNLFYIEDPFEEKDFESFSKLLKKFPDRLIVGDDLTATNLKRVEKAVKMKSVNAIIVKPNQCGSLLEVQKVCKLAKDNNIKIVFSHRSGETEETILADLAFGFQADFFKCGITGKEREAKIQRMIEIENSMK